MSYRKYYAAQILKLKVRDFLCGIYGDDFIMWESKKEFIWEGEPLKIKITIRAGYDIFENPVIIKLKGLISFDKHGRMVFTKGEVKCALN